MTKTTDDLSKVIVIKHLTPTPDAPFGQVEVFKPTGDPDQRGWRITPFGSGFILSTPDGILKMLFDTLESAEYFIMGQLGVFTEDEMKDFMITRRIRNFGK